MKRKTELPGDAQRLGTTRKFSRLVRRLDAIFIPSINGISHNPAERTNITDLAEGVKTLALMLYQLAEIRSHKMGYLNKRHRLP